MGLRPTGGINKEALASGGGGGTTMVHSSDHRKCLDGFTATRTFLFESQQLACGVYVKSLTTTAVRLLAVAGKIVKNYYNCCLLPIGIKKKLSL